MSELSYVSMEYFLAESDSLRSIISDKERKIQRLERALESAVDGLKWAQKKSAHMKSDGAGEINQRTTKALAEIEAILKGE